MMNKKTLRLIKKNRVPLLVLTLLLSLVLCGCAKDPAENSVASDSAESVEVSDPAENGPASPAGTQDTENTADAASAETSSADVSQTAAALSGKYDVNVLIKSDVPLIYKDYTVSRLDDTEKIAAALRELDNTLSIYPPGFFTGVKEGYCDSINICLAKDLQAVNNNNHFESANAFTTVEDDVVWLVLNIDLPLQRGILVHELTHVIDYRLLEMHQLRESEWNQLNPPSFCYYNTYLNEEGKDLRIYGSTEYTAPAEEETDRIWFYDTYSKTYAMEDRARLMEKLLENAVLNTDGEKDEAAAPSENPAGQESTQVIAATDDTAGQTDAVTEKCFASPHVRTKLRFYFYTLRQAFENARWPEETVWEAELSKADH